MILAGMILILFYVEVNAVVISICFEFSRGNNSVCLFSKIGSCTEEIYSRKDWKNMETL